MTPEAQQQIEKIAKDTRHRLGIGTSCLDENCSACLHEFGILQRALQAVYDLAVSETRREYQHDLSVIESIKLAVSETRQQDAHALCLVDIRAWVDEALRKHEAEYGPKVFGIPGLASEVAAVVWVRVHQALAAATIRAASSPPQPIEK